MSAPDRLPAADAPLPQVLQAVQARLAACRGAPADAAKAAFGTAMTCLVHARNARLRARGAEAAEDPQLRQLNAVLSLMASIEFPLAGFHRERLDQVARALDGLGGAPAP